MSDKNEKKTSAVSANSVWSESPSSGYMYAGCLPGDYLLPPPAAIPNAVRGPDPVSSSGCVMLIHATELYRFKETYNRRPKWFFAPKQAWWDAGFPRLPGSVIPGSPNESIEQQLKSEKDRSAKLLADLSTLRSKASEAHDVLTAALKPV